MDTTTTCEWFVLCDNRAVGTVAHPVLGSVPTCQRCADKLDLVFEDREPCSPRSQ